MNLIGAHGLLISLLALTTPGTEEVLASSASMQIEKYPSSIQKNYALFQEKCSQCHSLGTSLNSDMVLPSYWQKTIKSMQAKPGSNISDKDAQKIYEFLVFDSSERRKKELDDELSSLPLEQQKKEKEAIDQIRNKY